MVVDVRHGSPAYLCGVRTDDHIYACALATIDEIDKEPLLLESDKRLEKFHDALTNVIKNAEDENKAVVLAIFRNK